MSDKTFSTGYWINAEKQEIAEVQIDREDSLSNLQRLVGGPIQLAHTWPDGSVCFVDEDGIRHGRTFAFKITGSHYPYLIGNGIVVGPEYPNSAKTRPPGFPLGWLRGIVEFGSMKPKGQQS